VSRRKEKERSRASRYQTVARATDAHACDWAAVRGKGRGRELSTSGKGEREKKVGEDVLCAVKERSSSGRRRRLRFSCETSKLRDNAGGSHTWQERGWGWMQKSSPKAC
jgi:hypothetical protein